MRIGIKRKGVCVRVNFINGQITRKYLCIMTTFALLHSRDCDNEYSTQGELPPVL